MEVTYVTVAIILRLMKVIEKINDIGVKVIDSSEEYSYENDGIEYYDDYWTKNEEKIYVD